MTLYTFRFDVLVGEDVIIDGQIVEIEHTRRYLAFHAARGQVKARAKAAHPAHSTQLRVRVAAD